MGAVSPAVEVPFHFPALTPVFYQQACKLHIDTNIFQMCNDVGSNELSCPRSPFELSLYVVFFNDSRL